MDFLKEKHQKMSGTLVARNTFKSSGSCLASSNKKRAEFDGRYMSLSYYLCFFIFLFFNSTIFYL